MSEINTMRLDKWLWAARFFKTRALAQKQIELGRIKVNNERVKNSKYISVGDKVHLTLNSLPYLLTVLALNLAGEGLNDALNPRLARGRE